MAKFSKRLEKLDTTVCEKIQNINSIFILYPRFRAILAEIEECMVFSRSTPEPICLLLTGNSGVGKSSIIETYCQAYPPSDLPTGYVQPILSSSIPSPTSVRKVIIEMLDSLGAKHPERGVQADMAARLYCLIRECQVELVIMDEFQHLILSPTKYALKVVSNWIKTLVNKTMRPVVLCGMPESRGILQFNKQLANRFRQRVEMRPFSLRIDRNEYFEFLNAYNKAVSESLPAHLLDSDVPERLMLASTGHMRELTNLIKDSACSALLDGRDALDLRYLSSQFNLRTDRNDFGFNPFEISHQEVNKRLASLP